ncbi:MAG TPA: D-alanyl-D-alanine carboxypeptidase [Firmicutes bacterium]|nr:D-alanyl-D-alanine carboxypeptidase [Bacillota bacterium]
MKRAKAGLFGGKWLIWAVWMVLGTIGALGAGGALGLLGTFGVPGAWGIAAAQGASNQGGSAQAVPATTFDINAGAAILVDAASGQVLYEKNADEPLPPASMAKLMTMLLVMEEIDAGRLQLDEKVTTSARAAGIGGSQVYLRQGEVFTVEDLMKAVTIHSANDAAVALAEHVAGSVEAFVDAMNARAKELGMTKTYYANPDGLPSDPGQPPTLTTARDLTIIAREVIKYEEILAWASLVQADFRTQPRTILYNTNKLIGRYAGMDGLKTGHTEEAGYCLTATAKRGDIRLISVVMKTASEEERQIQTTRLLDYGFRNFTRQVLAPAGEEVGKLKVKNGWPGAVPVVAAADLAPLVRRGTAEDITTELRLLTVKAPVEKGAAVGTLVARSAQGDLTEVPVVTAEAVKRANFFIIFLRWLKGLIVGLFT